METPETIPKENKPKRDKLFLYLFLLMTISSVMLGWLYWSQKSETQTVVTESEVVMRDLQQLQTEYEALQTNDIALQKEIEEKKERIAQLQADAEKHKDDAYIISKLQKETNSLRDIMKHFVVEIDSLNTLNKKLIAEKDSVTTELKTEKDKSTALQTEKDKLYKVGSILKTSSLTVTALNIKSTSKEGNTNKAKKTDKIKIVFKLEENRIAPKGKRDIYVRIITPDGKEWTESADADHMFTFGNSKGFYAAKQTILYENEDMEVIIFVKKKDREELLPGKYLIEVNMDNVTIGNHSLDLE